MKRTPIPRKTPLRSTGRPKAKKRRASETRRIYGGEARIRFVAGLPCSVPMCPRRPSENAHSTTGGLSRKADAETILPLCSRHHRSLHEIGVLSFERMHGMSLTECAKRTEALWRKEHAA